MLRALPSGFIPPCLPTSAPQPPTGAIWLHEIKHDGYRVIARKDGMRVKLFSRPGNDLTARFPLIVEGAAAVTVLHRGRGGGVVRRGRDRILRPDSAPAL
jgi:ATP-dependent DNA ligase